MYRRKSGGGCVYADTGNVMLSYITRDEHVNMTFNRYVNAIVLTLYKLGIDAKASGRNDILIEGKKVSGNAFYHIPGHNIVHGTLLYDTDMENMAMSITPSQAKLASKGVESVRQHIALLKEHTTLPLEEVKAHIISLLCDKEFILGEEDLQRVEEIEQEYLSPDFIYGNNPRYTLVRQRRIEGVGDIELRMELKNDIIKQVNIVGDFFVVGDIDNRLLRPLRNVPYNEESVRNALPPRLDDLILHLEIDEFIDTIFNN
jgi:lipoic acid synthetase/lipoate-protein ligase A